MKDLKNIFIRESILGDIDDTLSKADTNVNAAEIKTLAKKITDGILSADAKKQKEASDLLIGLLNKNGAAECSSIKEFKDNPYHWYV